jgi:Ca-activated chloride channel family protein
MAVPVANRAANADALGFPSAIAEFGMLLRDSEYKGSSNWESVQSLATKFKGADSHGHRAEFIRLIGIADSVARLQSRRKSE